MKDIAQRIFRETLAAIDIRATLARKLECTGPTIRVDESTIDLRDFREILVIAIGKASFPMADGLLAILAPQYSPEGILVGPAPPPRSLPGWQTFVGGHPVPNADSFAAGRAILDRLARCGDRTLIFFLLSGGGSALAECPLDSGITLEDFRVLNSALVTSGAHISEINAVRKHLSAMKGGRLAAAAPHSMKITLGVSDVPEGQETALASGPTLPDPTTIAEAERVVRDFKVLEKLPPSIRTVFDRHALRETPKAGDPAFARAPFLLLLGERELLHAAHRALEAEGFFCLSDRSTDNWPIEKAADYLLGELNAAKKICGGRKAAVVSDGEVNSPVTGKGVGGRNSAFVLACVPKIAGKEVTVLSVGTDGIDGNSPAAGAVADGETLSRAQDAGLDPKDFFQRSDAYTFFERLGDAIVTGPTGNNLRDLRLFLAR